MDYTKYQQLAMQLVGKKFQNIILFVTAFTHRSYLNEHKKTVKEHNERLEFLGDAVLELVVTEYLYKHYDQPEGILTNWRSALVRTESISEAASKLGFAEYLRLSRGEKKGSDRAREQILANCFEAVIGAIYLEFGYEVSATFIGQTILIKLDNILADGSWLDSKTRLQELAQERENNTPVYRVLSEEGPDHEKTFMVGVFVGDNMRGRGKGLSKQQAQQQAASQAIRYYTQTAAKPEIETSK